MMMMLISTLPLCRRSRRLEISYYTNYQRLVLEDGDDAVMERGEEVEEVVVMEERRSLQSDAGKRSFGSEVVCNANEF